MPYDIPFQGAWAQQDPAFLAWYSKNANNYALQGGTGSETEDYQRMQTALADWRKTLTMEQLLGQMKNKTGITLYNDLQKAMNGPDLYSGNDIRNQTLAISGASNADWLRKQPEALGAAATAGMGESGFFQNWMGQAAAARQAATQGQITGAANQMRQANQDYRQQAIGSATDLLQSWLANKRKSRLSSMFTANQLNGGG